MERLDGKVAIVTGGARGIGQAVGRLFALEGAAVVVADVLAEEGEAVAVEIGGLFVALDVGDEEAWQSAVTTVEDRYGHVDVLVNDAGIHSSAPIGEQGIEAFRRMFEVNLLGTLLGIKSVVPAMRRAGGGAIVNIASGAGSSGAYLQSAYAATKWGVRGITKSVAMELGPEGIRVNAVLPGPIVTPLTRNQTMDFQDSRLPLRRAGQPIEVATAVLYLASDEASFVTGADLHVDGGNASGSLVTGQSLRSPASTR